MSLRRKTSRALAAAAAGSRRPGWVEALESRTLLAVDFSIAAMSDTQYVVESFADPSTFARQTAWVAANRSDPDYNFAFMAHQGDMLRRGYSNFQAGVAADALRNLDTGGVPYAVSIGNHDYDNQFDDLDRHVSSANFTTHFGDARYVPQRDQAHTISEYGSSLDQRNHFHVFSAGGRSFLVLSLEWQIPRAAQQWGQAVIDAHPQLPVILTTHEYLARTAGGRTTGTPVDAAAIGAQNGQQIFTNFVAPNDQIFMVLSGHTGATWSRAVTNTAGRSVLEIASDFESSQPNGGDGWLQAVKFDLGDPTAGRAGSVTVQNVRPADGGEQVGASATYAVDFASRLAFAPRAVPPAAAVGASPVVASRAVATPEGRMLVIDPRVGASDADDAVTSLRPILKTLPAHGAVYVRADGVFEYTPDPDPANRFASDAFEYVLSDGKGNSAAATITIDVRPSAPVYNYPVAESTVAGTRGGSLANLRASGDGLVETVTEKISSTAADVDHRWTFDVTPGADASDALQNLVVGVNAWRSFSNPGTGDEYHLAYSTNNSTWTDLTRLVPNSSKDVTRTRFDADEPYQLWALPAGLSGTVYLRATDVNTTGAETADTLTVDEIFIRSAVAFPGVSVSAIDGAETAAGTRPAKFTFRRTGAGASLREPLTVRFALSGTATPGADYPAPVANPDGTYSVTIAAGQAAAEFSVTPINDGVVEGAETLVTTLVAGDAYDVSSGGGAATANVVDFDASAPTAPALSVSGATSTSVSLAWTASADDVGVAGYDLYRNGVLVRSVDAGVTSVVDTGLADGTAYGYVVRARDAAGNEATSNGVSATTRLGGPTGLTGVKKTSGSGSKRTTTVTLSWRDNSAVESGFYVYSSRDGVNWTRRATVSAATGSGGTAAYATGALAAGTWWFRVTAYDANGESDPSNVWSVTV